MNKEFNLFKNEQLIPLSENDNGQILVSGRELHEFLDVKQDFSDWIKKQLEMVDAKEDEGFTLLKGKTSEIGGRPTAEYVLTIETAKEICMIAGVAPRTNAKTKKLSKQARTYFIKVEEAWNSPEMIMKRALEIADKKIQTLTLKIETDAPKVQFAEAVEGSKTGILIRELAKLLKQNGINIGQNRLFTWLRENGYLIRNNGIDYNQPTQRSMNQGLFAVRETVVYLDNGSTKIRRTPMVTGKGQQYFVNKFLNS